jgi:hypothetical protein
VRNTVGILADLRQVSVRLLREHLEIEADFSAPGPLLEPLRCFQPAVLLPQLAPQIVRSVSVAQEGRRSREQIGTTQEALVEHSGKRHSFESFLVVLSSTWLVALEPSGAVATSATYGSVQRFLSSLELP